MIPKTSQASSINCFTTAALWRDLIGIPYEKEDCWGIVRRFYKQVFNLELKSYYDNVPNNSERSNDLILSARGDFFAVDALRFGDIITMTILGIECHIGVFLNAETFLHTQKGTGCRIDRLHAWRHRITGYWRAQN